MTDEEFVQRVKAAFTNPVDEVTERYHSVQCAQDYDRVYAARVTFIIEQYDREKA